MQLKNILILVGTIWPVVGFCLALLIASVLPGWKRWLMLFVGPVVFLLPCYLFADQIAYNGNMLFVALFAIAYVVAIVYYPVIMITGIVLLMRQRHRQSAIE